MRQRFILVPGLSMIRSLLYCCQDFTMGLVRLGENPNICWSTSCSAMVLDVLFRRREKRIYAACRNRELVGFSFSDVVDAPKLEHKTTLGAGQPMSNARFIADQPSSDSLRIIVQGHDGSSSDTSINPSVWDRGALISPSSLPMETFGTTEGQKADLINDKVQLDALRSCITWSASASLPYRLIIFKGDKSMKLKFKEGLAFTSCKSLNRDQVT